MAGPRKYSSSLVHYICLSSIKLKTLFHTFVFAKAKSLLLELLGEFSILKKKNKNKLFFGSFRLHYNWCTSHANSQIQMDGSDHELSRYLEWLEEDTLQQTATAGCTNEIDQLADLFIANCHEKFRLEKQESYRRFQQMTNL